MEVLELTYWNFALNLQNSRRYGLSWFSTQKTPKQIPQGQQKLKALSGRPLLLIKIKRAYINTRYGIQKRKWTCQYRSCKINTALQNCKIDYIIVYFWRSTSKSHSQFLKWRVSSLGHHYDLYTYIPHFSSYRKPFTMGTLNCGSCLAVEGKFTRDTDEATNEINTESRNPKL